MQRKAQATRAAIDKSGPADQLTAVARFKRNRVDDSFSLAQSAGGLDADVGPPVMVKHLTGRDMTRMLTPGTRCLLCLAKFFPGKITKEDSCMYPVWCTFDQYKSMPIDFLASQISKAHDKYVREPLLRDGTDLTTIPMWQPRSVQAHLEQHMNDPDFQLLVAADQAIMVANHALNAIVKIRGDGRDCETVVDRFAAKVFLDMQNFARHTATKRQELLRANTNARG